MNIPLLFVTAEFGLLARLLSTARSVAVRLRLVDRATDRVVSEAAEHRAKKNQHACAAVQTRAAELESILDYAPAAVFIRDLSGRYVVVSRSYIETFGLDPERVAGKTIRELHPDRSRELVAEQEAIDRRVIESGVPVEREETYRIHGDLRTYLVFEFPAREASGKIDGVCGISIDITVRKRIEEAQHRFIAIVGHDLRSPLGAIVLGAQMLRTDELTAEARLQIATRIARSAERMRRIIVELLDFARAHAGGGIPIAPEPIDLAAVTRDVVDELRTAFPDLSIETRCAGDSTGTWDPARMAQVVSNLVSNAAQHGARETPVRIELVATQSFVRLAVKNKVRQRVDPDQLSWLFDPFQRGEVAESSVGLGLGLYIVREIVRAHGGSVEACVVDDQFSVLVRVPKSVTA